ncbi:MAG: GTPase Era [Arsenophonus sp.]
MNNQKIYCGFVAIVGKTNVGKSTLLNKLLGQKVSITSCKPKTTRQLIMGINTEENYQIIYIDTPGLHIKKNKAINNLIKQTSNSSIDDVELIIFVVDSTHLSIDDNIIMNQLRHLSRPVLLAINKIDNIIDKSNLLPYIDFLSKEMNFLYIIPISAKKNINIDIIIKVVQKHIPEAIHYFPSNYITNCSKHFMASEIIREKLMRFLGDELPYSITVEIEQFMINKLGAYNINGLILVKRNGQKKIVIGKNANKIKKIGIEARIDMEIFFSTKVNLKLWVKVNDKFLLHSFLH